MRRYAKEAYQNQGPSNIPTGGGGPKDTEEEESDVEEEVDEDYELMLRIIKICGEHTVTGVPDVPDFLSRFTG